MTIDEKQTVIDFLANELREASQAYYSGEDILTDVEFDSKYDFLKSIDPTNSIFKEISKGYKLIGIEEKERFKHPLTVGSVDKVNSLEKLKKWLKPGATFSTKIDGNSIVAYYNEGTLENIVTRGTDNVGIIRTAKLRRKFPATIDVPGYVMVRGEAAIKKSVYASNPNFNKDKASRSAVAGAITRKDNWKQVIDCVDVITYTFMDCNTEEDLSTKYDWDKWFIVEHQKDIKDFNDLDIDAFKKKYKDDYEYDADGAVFKNPDGSMLAFKFEDEKGYTDLLDVKWTIGKDQRLTPVAILKPIQLSGATISKASMGSYARAISIKAWPVTTTHTVELKRANEIIPYINSIITSSGSIKNGPEVKCPICGCVGKQNGEHIFCVNPTCSNVEHSRLISFSEHFYPEGLSNTTIIKFYEAYEIKSLMDLLNFKMPNRKEIYGVGDSTHILFEEFVKRTTDDIDIKVIYQTFLPSCGNRASTKIVDVGFDIYSYVKNPLGECKKLLLISNFNSNIVTSLINMYSTLIPIIEKRNWIQDKSAIGKGTFCITGARFSSEQIEKIKESGWIEDSTIKKTTTILVTKNTNSTSSKVEKAKKYGIQIMTIDAFLNHISI